jgi:hypothetical protein
MICLTIHQNVTNVQISPPFGEKNVVLLTVSVFYPYVLFIVTAAMLDD